MALGLFACADPGATPSFPTLVEVRTPDNVQTDLLIDVKNLDTGDLGYVVAFHNGHGLPTTLSYNSQSQILGEGPPPFETLIGTAIFPGAIAAGPLAQAPADVLVVLDGPAVAQTKVTYSVPYECNGMPQHLSGTSTFTFFPGGRIVRFDNATANDTALERAMTTNDFTCNAGMMNDSVLFFTSFWTFLDMSSMITTPDGTAIDTGAQGFIDYNQSSACFRYPDLGVHIGIRYTGSQTRVIDNVEVMRPDAGSADRFVFDFARNPPMLDAGFQDEVGSAIQLSPSAVATCQSLLDPLEDRGVFVNDRTTPLDRDGIYSDSGGNYGDRVTIQAGSRGLLPGFVVALAGVHGHLRVASSGAGQFYVPQLDRDGQRTLIWFRDALEPGATIEVELLE